jgi:aromatic-L-amino-acid decarboxylase
MSDAVMSPDEFRRAGREMVDWIAGYMESVEEFPVLAQVVPGDIAARLPLHPPADGEDWEAILDDVDEIIMPGITHWQSPSYFAYFQSNSSGPAILAEMLIAALGTQGMLWSTSPAATELETRVLDWLAEVVGLPPAFHSSGSGGGVIQDTASSAVLCAILAARERATGWASNDTGVDREMVAYTSTQAHSSVVKGIRVAGTGGDRLRLVEVDAAYAMRPDRLEEAIREDLAAGRTPFFVMATVGTTSSHALDPVRQIGEICAEHGIWYHVDAAHAGTAAICPEYRYLQDGVELADSYSVNPHKWLLTSMDLSAFYVADRSSLIRTLSVLPEYLRNQASETGAVIDYRDWHIPLGRRFRALKLWFVLRYFGVTALQEMVRDHVSLAHRFATWVEQDPGFELAAPAPLNLVCFRHVGGDDVNQRIMDAVNASGRAFFTHTKLDGKLTLRMSIGHPTTEERHVAAAWESIREVAAT